MDKITEKDMKEVRKAIEAKFPDDPDLQQVHIARKIIAREAELEGMSSLEYIKITWVAGWAHSPGTRCLTDHQNTNSTQTSGRLHHI